MWLDVNGHRFDLGPADWTFWLFFIFKNNLSDKIIETGRRPQHVILSIVRSWSSLLSILLLIYSEFPVCWAHCLPSSAR